MSAALKARRVSTNQTTKKKPIPPALTTVNRKQYIHAQRSKSNVVPETDERIEQNFLYTRNNGLVPGLCPAGESDERSEDVLQGIEIFEHKKIMHSQETTLLKAGKILFEQQSSEFKRKQKDFLMSCESKLNAFKDTAAENLKPKQEMIKNLLNILTEYDKALKANRKLNAMVKKNSSGYTVEIEQAKRERRTLLKEHFELQSELQNCEEEKAKLRVLRETKAIQELEVSRLREELCQFGVRHYRFDNKKEKVKKAKKGSESRNSRRRSIELAHLLKGDKFLPLEWRMDLRALNKQFLKYVDQSLVYYQQMRKLIICSSCKGELNKATFIWTYGEIYCGNCVQGLESNDIFTSIQYKLLDSIKTRFSANVLFENFISGLCTTLREEIEQFGTFPVLKIENRLKVYVRLLENANRSSKNGSSLLASLVPAKKQNRSEKVRMESARKIGLAWKKKIQRKRSKEQTVTHQLEKAEKRKNKIKKIKSPLP